MGGVERGGGWAVVGRPRAGVARRPLFPAFCGVALTFAPDVGHAREGEGGEGVGGGEGGVRWEKSEEEGEEVQVGGIVWIVDEWFSEKPGV